MELQIDRQKHVIQNPQNLQLLQSALKELSRFRTLQCGQLHENVVQVARAGSGERSHDDHPGWKFSIQGLCSREIRNSTLGCSHSIVIVHYNQLAEKLISNHAVEAKNIPLQEINDLIGKIYTMDHEKGKLEKDYAVLKENGQKQADEMTSKLENLRMEHTVLVKELELLHQGILAEIRREIAKYEALY